MAQHEAAANQIAQWLEDRPEVARVHHISLPSFEQSDLFKSSFCGSSGLFSLEPKVQSRDKLMAFGNELNLFARAISWGGYESLVVTLPIHPMEEERSRWIVRLSIGLEEPDELISDLERALEMHLRP